MSLGLRIDLQNAEQQIAALQAEIARLMAELVESKREKDIWSAGVQEDARVLLLERDSLQRHLDAIAAALGQPREYRCTRCNGLAYFTEDEKVWRHAGEPHEAGFLEQGFCDRYGYPIDVATTAYQPDQLPEMVTAIKRENDSLWQVSEAAEGLLKASATVAVMADIPNLPEILSMRKHIHALLKAREALDAAIKE